MKKLVIISGVSGAGKSQVLNILEDNEYFCVDNLPAELFDKFVQLVKTTHRDKFAVSIDVRSVEKLQDLVKIYSRLKKYETKNIQIVKLFLEADVGVLIRRFSETRRKHPLGGPLLSAIKKEKRVLKEIRKQSDIVIDTSTLTLSELKQAVIDKIEQQRSSKLAINIVSFGYRFGIPLNADLVFDTRFLPNPNYVSKLKVLTGKDKNVKSYVLSSNDTLEFLGYIKQLIKFLLPKIVEEGKNYFTIAFGCTGGQHRSVVIAEEIYRYLQSLKKEQSIGYSLSLIHRDI
ncbi:MAG: RNase adapter RapZ [Endomicrobia bacterium]|nr:RNase adapter RapZ [Endomicrobiia bacterium]